MKEAHFKGPDEFEKALKDVLSPLHQPAAGGLVSVAVDESVEPHQLITGRLVVSEREEAVRETLQYDELTLVEQWVPAARLDDYVSALVRGAVSVASVAVSASFNDFTLRRDLRTHGNVTGWPEWRGVLRMNGRTRDYPRDEVARYGLPPYRTIAHAVNEWVHRRSRNADANSPEFNAEFIVGVPDTRGRLMRAGWVGGTVTVIRESHLGDDSGLQLQVRYIGDAAETFELISPCPAEVVRSVPTGTESILLYLVHRDGGLLAERLLGAYQRQRAQPPEEVLTLEAETERDLAGGECEFVEFKPFIKVQDPKEEELERSLVAFANTGGGRLFIGVNDDGSPQGARALKDTVKDAEGQQAALGVLARRLETVIADRVKPERPFFEVHQLDFKGFPVLMIRVSQGKKAYSTAREFIYVRHRASNCVASISEIRDLLASREAAHTVAVPGELVGT